MSLEIAINYLETHMESMKHRRDQLANHLAAKEPGGTVSYEKKELDSQIEELNLACKILSSSRDGLKNFVDSINPVIIKIHTGKELTTEERNKIVQFYLEVSTTIYL